jgi:glycosyltransferase involved in cell wall biosynthesis
MKITVIGPTYPFKGGISHFTTMLVQNLRKKHSVDFISWKRQYPAFLYPVELKDTKSKHPVKTDARFYLDFYNPFSWIRSGFDVKKYNSDLLILNWASPIQAPIYFVICFVTKFFTKANIFYVCHNVLPHENSPFDKMLIKLAFGRGDSFIVHSSDDKKILESLVKHKKIIKGFLPIFDMFDRSRRYNIQETKQQLHLGNKVLLFFGYIRPYKGLKYLLEAMPKIINKYPDLSLLVVGEFWSKDKGSYLEIVNKLHISKNILFVSNYVPNEELCKYFSVSDVVVLPYITATQSASLQTAYAFNKPVISTSVGGLKDVMKDGVTGYIIKPKESDDIVFKVDKFYKEWKTNNKFTKFKKSFSWDNYIKLIS